MMVPDFLLDSVNDQVIHPDGEIAHHLIEIASEEPVNISQYIINRAGTSLYFPTSYLPYRTPSPGVELALTNGNHLDLIHSSKSNGLLNSHTTSSSTTTTSSSQLLTDIKMFICTKFHENISLNSIQLLDFITKYSSSFYPLPDDSVILIIIPSHSEVIFINCNYQVEYLSICANKFLQWNDWLQLQRGVTVIDGKFLTNKQSKIRRYLCEDISIMNGKQLLLLNEYSYNQRKELLGVWFFDSPFDEQMFFSFVEFTM